MSVVYLLVAAYLGFGVLVGLTAAGFVAIGAEMSGCEWRGPSMLLAFLVGVFFWPIFVVFKAKS